MLCDMSLGYGPGTWAFDIVFTACTYLVHFIIINDIKYLGVSMSVCNFRA